MAFAGSRPRLPAPFGPARNGALYYHGADGAIYTVDPTTLASRAIVTGPEPYSYPVPSRDGERISIEHTAAGLTQLLVSDRDGSNVRPLAGSYSGILEKDWSPDGRQLAIISSVAGVQSLSIVEADGSGSRTLDLGHEANSVWYLPDGRLAFAGAQEPGGICHRDAPTSVCGLFVVNPDGTGLQTILQASAYSGRDKRGRLRGLGLDPSPDGRSLVYVRWTSEERGRPHIVDIATGQDRPLRVDGIESEWRANTAQFSPDGTLILIDHIGVSADHWAVVPVAGGSIVDIGPAWPSRPTKQGPAAFWSPDGGSVVAFYPTHSGAELWLLDPTGHGRERRVFVQVPAAPTWQRQAP